MKFRTFRALAAKPYRTNAILGVFEVNFAIFLILPHRYIFIEPVVFAIFWPGNDIETENVGNFRKCYLLLLLLLLLLRTRNPQTRMFAHIQLLDPQSHFPRQIALFLEISIFL